MVCVLCSLDAAANDIIEICADKDFSKGLSFYSTDRAQLDGGVKWKKASINVEILSYHTTE